MGKKTRIIAMLVVLCMLATMIPVVPTEEYEASEKVGPELLEMIGITYEELISGNFVDSGEIYSCVIWLHDVKIEEAVEAGIDAAEKTREEYSARSLYDYPYTIYEADGLTYVDVNLDEEESDEYVQTYIEAEREAAVELYSANNNSFVAENFMARDMSVTYVSQYSPCVFANLSVTKIAELIVGNDVVCIGYVNDDCAAGENSVEATEDPTLPTLSVSEIEEVMEVFSADVAKSRYNVTGEGVKIGQIEPRCPDDSNVIVNPSYSNTEVAGVGNSHADNVHLIMSTVAPDAIYYATGTYSDNNVTTPHPSVTYYEQIEWLLSQGVNIINSSYGFKNYNQYDERTRWIDHIAYNHDVHFVMAAGNDAEIGVLSPGMAYNIITVGETASDGDYEIMSTSSYNNTPISVLDGITYKPDMVAPGKIGNKHGTSYATPFVSATIALLCEYEPSLKTKQYTVKAILAASTGKETRKYVLGDSEFRQYGAGMIDARSAIWVVSKNNYSYRTGILSASNISKTYNMTVTSSDTCMRIALAYGIRVAYDESDTTHQIDDLDSWGEIGEVWLTVYDPNGEKVIETEGGFGANLKVIEFDPRLYGTGTYTLEVMLLEPQSDGEVTNFGIAWR